MMTMTDPETTLHLERRTVRSGEKIAYEGHVVIMGDVNPGAEVISGYNITVAAFLKKGSKAFAREPVSASFI